MGQGAARGLARSLCATGRRRAGVSGVVVKIALDRKTVDIRSQRAFPAIFRRHVGQTNAMLVRHTAVAPY